MAFPFSIEDEAKLLPLKNAKITGGTIYADCPFCGSRGALHISVNRNMWNCCSCMMKGSNNSGGGRTELYAKYYNMSNSEAYHNICDLYGIQRDYRSTEEIEEPREEQSQKDVREIDYVYRALLSFLTLTEEHKKSLRKRGLNDAAIQKHQYRSVPVTGIDNIVTALLSYDIDLKGIPGFYMSNGKWTVNFTPALAGILIPVINREGYIQGMQIRLNKPIRGSKYMWFSSQGKEGGSSPGSPVHFIGDPLAKTVVMTEGSLKANIAYEMSKYLMSQPLTFVAIAGCGQFNSIRKALASLKEYGCELVYDGFDMDKMKNPNVYRSMAKIFDIAKEIGIRMEVYRWNAIEIYGNFKRNTPYKVLINDTEYAFCSTYKNGKREFWDEFYADEETGRLIIPEPILDPLHPHQDVDCKLIDTETGDYMEFKMNVDASINRYQDCTVWQRKGIDDYFYSLACLKNKQRKN